MSAARGFNSASTTASPYGTSGASTSQPKDKEGTPIPMEALLDDLFILPSVHFSEEELDAKPDSTQPYSLEDAKACYTEYFLLFS